MVCEQENPKETLIKVLQRDLAESKEREQQESIRSLQLDELARQLTEWNTCLEEKVSSLEAELINKDEEMVGMKLGLEKELVEITEKRIELLQDYSKLEDDLIRIKRLAKEQEDVLGKIWQENQTLKNKLVNCLSPRQRTLSLPLVPTNALVDDASWQEVRLSESPPSDMTRLLRFITQSQQE